MTKTRENVGTHIKDVIDELNSLGIVSNYDSKTVTLDQDLLYRIKGLKVVYRDRKVCFRSIDDVSSNMKNPILYLSRKVPVAALYSYALLKYKSEPFSTE